MAESTRASAATGAPRQVQLSALARLAATLPSMDHALDELIARAHQVDPEAGAAAASAAAEARAQRAAVTEAAAGSQRAAEAKLQDAETRAHLLRDQVEQLERQLAEAQARPLAPVVARAPGSPAGVTTVAPTGSGSPAGVVTAAPAVPRAPGSPAVVAALPGPRSLPWRAIGGAFAAGLVVMFVAARVTGRDEPAPLRPAALESTTATPSSRPTAKPIDPAAKPIDPAAAPAVGAGSLASPGRSSGEPGATASVPPAHPVAEHAKPAEDAKPRAHRPAATTPAASSDGALVDPFGEPHPTTRPAPTGAPATDQAAGEPSPTPAAASGGSPASKIVDPFQAR